MTKVSEAIQIAFHHHQAGRVDLAEEIYRRIIAVEPQADVLHMLGILAFQRGQHEMAIEHLGQALATKPNDASFYNTLGVVVGDQGKLAEAAASLRRAVDMRPDYAEAHHNLGDMLRRQGDTHAALACYRRAVELSPDFALAYNGLASVLADLDRLDEALACCRRAMELAPQSSEITDNYVCLLRYHPGMTPAAMFEACAEYERRHCAGLCGASPRHGNSSDADRPLLLGFVSPRFACGPVGAFLVRVLENLDPRECQVACYSDGGQVDATTARFRAAAGIWRDVAGLADEKLAEQVRADCVDILFDLAGHASRNRLPVFARKPAPVQVTWIDSVGTTGLSTMDYVLADRHVLPAEAEPYYSERVLRLPDGYLCYDPLAAVPPPGPLPAAGRGYVTFGNFNHPVKMNLEVVKLWGQILRSVPDSRLLLKHVGLDQPAMVAHWRQAFEREGVAAGRIEFQGHSPLEDYLHAYREIDISLDPFPHNGGVTTCDSLWMGVPVITCPGATFAGRQSLSHLSAIGFTETIAGSLDEYVDIAVRLASDLPRLAQIRSRLRGQMAASPLCDGPRFAENLMQLLRRVWQDWCRSASSRPEKGLGEVRSLEPGSSKDRGTCPTGGPAALR